MNMYSSLDKTFVTRDFQINLLLYFPQEQWFSTCQFSIPDDFVEHNYGE